MRRFTDTEKWRDPWFQALSHGEKLLFLYLIDNCNNAGFYEEKVRETCFHLNITEKQYEAALRGLSRGLKGASGWLWVRRFLYHQKNDKLDPEKNQAHRQIVNLLDEQRVRFGKVPEILNLLAPPQGPTGPIGTVQVKVKVRKKESPERKKQADEIYEHYPHKVGKPDAVTAILKAIDKGITPEVLLDRTKAYAEVRSRQHGFTPNPSTWFNQERFNDDPKTWEDQQSGNGKHPPIKQQFKPI